MAARCRVGKEVCLMYLQDLPVLLTQPKFYRAVALLPGSVPERITQG